MAFEVAGVAAEALQLGRGEVRVSASSSAAPSSNALDEYARAFERGDQAADESRSDLSGRSQLPEAGPGLVHGDSRTLDGGWLPLTEHGSSSGAAAGRRGLGAGPCPPSATGSETQKNECMPPASTDGHEPESKF